MYIDLRYNIYMIYYTLSLRRLLLGVFLVVRRWLDFWRVFDKIGIVFGGGVVSVISSHYSQFLIGGELNNVKYTGSI